MEVLHRKLVFDRRTKVLAHFVAAALGEVESVLDVGCGDGTIDALLHRDRPELIIRGVDVLIRPQTKIPVEPFDGEHLPFADKSFDAVTFIDTLHHSADPMVLLCEAKRVARRVIVIKDHTKRGPFAGLLLRFMDVVGNAHHGVSLPFNYWPERRWRAAFASLGLRIESWKTALGLYPFPANIVFEAGLHFVARLEFEDRTAFTHSGAGKVPDLLDRSAEC